MHLINKVCYNIKNYFFYIYIVLALEWSIFRPEFSQLVCPVCSLRYDGINCMNCWYLKWCEDELWFDLSWQGSVLSLQKRVLEILEPEIIYINWKSYFINIKSPYFTISESSFSIVFWESSSNIFHILRWTYSITTNDDWSHMEKNKTKTVEKKNIIIEWGNDKFKDLIYYILNNWYYNPHILSN